MSQNKNSDGKPSSNEDILRKTFYDVKSPGSLSTAKRLLDEVKKQDKTITADQVLDWLQQQQVFQLYKPRRKKFPRRKIVKLAPNDTWSADLVDTQALAPFNANFSWILCVIDNFSVYAFCRCLKAKSKEEMLRGFKSILEEANTKCKNLQTDEGKEFLSLGFFFEQEGINRFSTTTKIKASKVERFQRTLENYIYKYMTANNTKKYFDVLQDIVYSYNRRKSRAIFDYRPIDAYTDKKVIEILKKKFDKEREDYEKKFSKSKYVVGQKVRVAKDEKLFDRGYVSQFEDEVRTIREVINSRPACYKVSGKRRIFYEPEISPVHGNIDDDDEGEKSKSEKLKSYFIERTRKVGGKVLRNNKVTGQQTEYLVKSHNDPSISTWMKQPQVEKLQNEGFLL